MSTATVAAGTIFSLKLDNVLLHDSVVVTGLPAGITFSFDEFSGTPTTLGVYHVAITKTDAFGDVGTDTLTITVTGGPYTGIPTPTITSVSPASFGVASVSLTINGTGLMPGQVFFVGSFGTLQGTSVSGSGSSITCMTPDLDSSVGYDNDVIVIVKNTDNQTANSDVTLVGSDQFLCPVPVFTSLCSSANPIYSQENPTPDTAMSDERVFGMGTNVEVLYYSGIDAVTNRLLSVFRNQNGTTSTRHAPNDIVFKGLLSIQVSPMNLIGVVTTPPTNIDGMDCLLRSNGKIEMKARITNSDGSISNSDSDTQLAYAAYQAVLVKNRTTLDYFDPTAEC